MGVFSVDALRSRSDKLGTVFTIPAPKKFVTAKQSPTTDRSGRPNENCNSRTTVVQVLQDLFYVLLHVLFCL